jgi:hypothetical protein
MEIKNSKLAYVYLALAAVLLLASIFGGKTHLVADKGGIALLAALIAVSMSYQLNIIETLKQIEIK